VISGTVGENDDLGETDLEITFPGNVIDPLEDLFSLQFEESGPLFLQLQAANALADLDLYLIDTEPLAIRAESNGPAPNIEQISIFPPAPANYLVGGTWCCGSATTSGFTLSVGLTPPPPTAPPAGLTPVGLFFSGDGLLTRDATLGLDWLDLTLTAGLSYDEIESGVDGWAGAGFRHATAAEVCSLLSRAATAPPACPGPFASSVSADLLTPFQSTLRATRRTYSRVFSEGLFNDGDGGSVGKVKAELSSGSSTVIVGKNAYDGATSSHFVGHFLVRAAPSEAPLIFADGFETRATAEQ
jgi:hypothetical protein